MPTAKQYDKIYNADGKLLLEQLTGNYAEINVSSFAKGTYIVVVNNKLSQKFVEE